MADKYNQVEPKISTGILVSIIASVVITIVLVLIALPSNSEKIYNDYVNTADDYFTEDHPYYEVKASKIERMIDGEETFVLFISSPDCQACQLHIGTIQRYFESTGAIDEFDMIYYLNPLKDAEGFERLVDAQDHMSSATPQMFVFVNGELTEAFDANLSTTEQSRNTNVRTFFEDAIAALEEE